MHAYVINSNGSSNNLPCYSPDSHQLQKAVYWSTGIHSGRLHLLT